VPGIGGSVLRAKNRQTGTDNVVWVNLDLSGLRNSMRLMQGSFNPDTARYEQVDPNIEIYPERGNYGLDGISNLAPKLTLLKKMGNYFVTLIDSLKQSGHQPGRDLFALPYDWRQSTRNEELMDEYEQMLKTASEAAGGARVDIISHSLGCLVTRSFIAVRRAAAQKYIRKWIAVAAPWRGAPGKMMLGYITGYSFDLPGPVAPATMAHQLSVQCPSVAEMLPDDSITWDPQPYVELRYQDVARPTKYYPTDFVKLIHDVNQDNVIETEFGTLPLPVSDELLAYASKTQQLWRKNLDLPSSISFYTLFGQGQNTLHYVIYDTSLRWTTDALMDNPSYNHMLHTDTDGDGTVCLQSASSDPFRTVQRLGVKATHQGIVSDGTAITHMQSWLNRVEPHELLRVESEDDASSGMSAATVYTLVGVGAFFAAALATGLVVFLHGRRQRRNEQAESSRVYRPLQELDC